MSVPYLKATFEGVRLHVYVQPGASKNQIVGTHGEALKIKIKAPPEDGKANAELIAFLAKHLGVAKSRVELVWGATSRAKTLLINGVSCEEVEDAFQ